MNLSIIIPCKNESESIRECLESVVQVCPRAQILVMDSGCEKTKVICESFKTVQYHQCQPDRGKGDAIQQGILKANHDILVQFDADMQFFAQDIPKLVQPLVQHECHMTLGSRFLNHSGNPEPFVRTFGNRMVSLVCCVLFGHSISDALAGFKAWKREVTANTPLQLHNFSYEIELFARALQNGFVVRDVPVRYCLRVQGESKVSIFRVGFQLLKDALWLRFKRI